MKKKFWLFFFFLVMLNLPALCQATRIMLTSISPGHIIPFGNDKKVYGTSSVVTFQESDGSILKIPVTTERQTIPLYTRPFDC